MAAQTNQSEIDKELQKLSESFIKGVKQIVKTTGFGDVKVTIQDYVIQNIHINIQDRTAAPGGRRISLKDMIDDDLDTS